MGIEFLVRVRRVTLALTILGALATSVYVGLAFGLAVLLGSLWSLANLLWLESLGRLIFAALKGEGAKRSDLLAVLIGTPLLPLAGWALLASPLPLMAVMIGFWVLYGVVVLKGFGIMLARALDFSTGRSRESVRSAVHRPLPKNRALGVVGWATVAVLASTFVLMAVASPDKSTSDHASSTGQTSSDEKHEPKTGHGEEDLLAVELHEEEEHGEGHEAGTPHLPTLTGVIHNIFPDNPVATFLYKWEDVFFAMLAAAIILLIVQITFSHPNLVPGKGQAAVELVAGGMRDFIVTTFGPHMARYVPFVGTVFLYILIMNWMGMVPLLKSPTASLNTTAAMAVVVFLYAIYTAVRTQGLLGYLYHLAGEPKDLLGWGIAVILFPIELMGEFIKPISLAARLFGNIFGEDLLVAVFVGIGAALMAWQPLPLGFPLQLPFVFLALTLSAVQAVVFALLAAVYLHMAQPHHEEEEHGAEESGAQPAHA